MKKFTNKISQALSYLFTPKSKNQKDNHQSFKRKGYTMFICMTLVALFGFSPNANAQTTLAAGDVAIIAINSANPDMFSIVLLKSISTNTVINFTDNGFTGTNTTGRTGEGFLTYTAPSNQSAGTVLTWTNGMSISGTGWSSNNPTNFAFNGSGDQLFAFQGITSNWAAQTGITLLFGMNYGIALSGTSGASNTLQPSTGILPATAWLNLPTATNANGYFANGISSATTVSVSGSASTLLTLFVDASKWFGTTATAATFPSYTFTVITCTSPTASVLSGTATICSGSSTDLSVAITGGTSPFTVVYSDGSSNFTVNSYTSGSNISVSPSSTKTYSLVSVTSTGGCVGTGNSGTPTVNVNALPTAGIINNSNTTELNCTTTSINVTATGGTSYSWSGGASLSTATNSFASAGTYTVTATSSGCTATSSITITSNTTVPSVGITNNSSGATELNCATTAINVTATGGTSYSWSGGASLNTATNTFVSDGTYTVTVTSNGCTSSAAITITQDITAPTPSINGPTSLCSGSSSVLDAGLFANYQWSTGEATQMISVNTTNSYTVTVTSANGCSGSASVTLTVNANPTPSITGALSFCSGSSTNLDAGSYTSYAWSTGAATQTINVTTAGTFTVTVTNASGCAGTANVTTTVNAAPTPSISGSTSFCSGSSTTLDAGSYISYAWSTGEITQTINVNTAGTYTVTVTDANGCTGTASVTTTVNALPTQPAAFTAKSTFVYQNDNTIPYTVTNTSGVTYNWSYSGAGATINGTSNSVTIDYSAVATSGALSVTASNGCGTSAARTLAVYVNTAIALNATNLDYSFVTVGCNRVDYLDTAFTTGDLDYSTGRSTANVYQLKRLFNEIAHLNPLPKFLIMTGDIVMGYKTPSTADTTELAKQLNSWVQIYQASPLASLPIQLVAIPGNHETQDKNAGKHSFVSAEQIFTRIMAPYILGSNGPGVGGPDALATDQSKLTYSFDYHADHFIIMDTDPVGKDNQVPYKWIGGDIQTARANNARNIFAFGHKPAYSSPFTPAGGLDAAATLPQRDSLWKYLEDNNCAAMFSAHEHLWDSINPHPGKTWQVIAGNGGSRVEPIWVGAGKQYYGYTIVNVYTDRTINVMGVGRNTTQSTTAGGTPYPINEDFNASTVRNNFNICLTTNSYVTVAACYSYIWHSVNYTSSGNYTFTGTNVAGCDSVEHLALTINSSITASINGSTSFCAGSSTTLDAGSYTSYAWSTGAATQTINVTTAGTYTVTVTNASGCTGTASVTTTVNALPVVSFTLPATSVGNAVVTLTGSPVGGTFSGTGVSGNTFTASVAGVGGPYTITYTYTDINGCSNSVSHTTTVIAAYTGPCTSTTPYTLPVAAGEKTTSMLTTLDVIGGYEMEGIPDGLGAFDNNNGTFTLLMNHELGNTVGVVRAHGSIGSFVSKWIINKATLCPISGSDLIQNVNLWNSGASTYTTYNAGNPSTLARFGRFCSADLPTVSALYNAGTGLGTQERIFMNGEETNDESRAMAHIVTGPNGGTSWELPALGKGAWENGVANPTPQNKTIVGMDNDGTDGQVYMYIGTKTNTGTEIEKAGLTNGHPFGVKVTGFSQERINSTTINLPPALGTHFDLIDLGDVRSITGVAFNTLSNTNGITKFSRPEDGAWDPNHADDYYFNTTDQLDQVNDGIGTQVGRTRVWKLHFTDIYNPELGGTIEAVLDGTEGLNMLDNMAIDHYGHLLLQEDVGGNAHNGKMWQYTIATDALKLITKQDPARFGDIGVAPTAPFTIDEETSGVIDVQEILGPGHFLSVIQDHHLIAGAAVEGGQLFELYNPDTYASSLCATTSSTTVSACDSLVWNGHTYTNSGTFTYHTTNTAGCDSAATLVLTINPLPTVAISGSTSFCAGSSTTLDAGSYTSYAWSTGAATQTINVTTAGTFTVTVTNANGCTGTASVTTTANALPTASITGTLSFCSGGSTALDAGSFSSYAWSTGAAAQTINVTTVGTYTVIVTNVSGCTASASVTTIVLNAPAQPAAFTVSTSIINAGQTGVVYTVPNDPTVTYTWTYSGTGVTINGSTNSVSVDFASNATAGTISVTASNSCGVSLARTIAITINTTTFAAGNLVVLQTTGAVSKASTAITLKEFTTSGAAASVVLVPASGPTPMQTAGVYGGSEGFLTTSADNKYLVLGGYGTAATFADITGTASSLIPRVIGTVTPSGVYSQVASSNTFYSLNDIRGAVSDGINYWASGASNANVDGINYFGPGAQAGLATGAIPPKGYGIRIFNGQIYYSTQKAGPSNSVAQLGIFALGAGLPTTGTVTVSQIINTGSIIPQDFSINATTDVCYIAVNLNTAAGGIQKWTKSGSVWTLAYTLGTGVTNIGAYGLVVDYSGANPVLYATTFETTGNRVIKIIDTGAASIASTIVAATAGVFNKGISFAPVNLGTPTVNLSVSTTTASETNATVVIVTASASSPVSGNQTVSLNVSGIGITAGDYSLSDSTITIPAGSTTGSVTFTVVDDTVIESTETAVLTISNPSSGILLGAITSQNISITDNDAGNPPTIVMNTDSTSNYIDGGVTIAPTSPYGFSGVVNDPKDPGSTLGIFFTVNDVETATNSLTVTATSSNAVVVPNANLIVSGSGAIRNVKITPIGVGYSTITISVTDGANNVSSYIISYAASDAAPIIIAANTQWHTGMSDASDAIALDDNYYASGDDELDVINVYSRSASGLPAVSYNYAANLNLPDPAKPEVDVEAGTRSTSVTNRMYWTGSMSNGKLPYDNKPNRDRLFATSVTGTGANASFTTVGYVNIRTALLAWGDANGYAFSTSAAAGVNSKAPAGFSLEGMCFGPDNTTLFLGLRAPLVPTSLRTNAVIAPVLNFETWFNNGNPSGAPTFGPPIELNLDNRGIRDIIRLSNGTYIIIAGSPIEDGSVNNIYKWSGYASDAPVAISNIAGGILNMEGVMEVHDTTTGTPLSLTKLQIISDGGSQILYQDNFEAKDFSDLNLRKFRSDVITGLDLNICTGFTAAIFPGSSTDICPGTAVTLNATSGLNNTYLWSNGAVTPVINATAFQSYTVTVTHTTTGCIATSAAVAVTNKAPSDINADGVTNVNDFLLLLGKYNQNCTCPEDINGDGVVNVNDFLILLGKYNQTCN